MPIAPVNPLVRPRLAAPLALMAGCLLAAGCGGSGHGTGSTHTFPGGITPIGPANIGANLTGLMAANQFNLKHVKAHCPSGPVTHFPVLCRFTAIEVAPLPGTGKRIKKNFQGPYRVAGTIKAIGVYYRTRTYEYALDFAPTP